MPSYHGPQVGMVHLPVHRWVWYTCPYIGGYLPTSVPPMVGISLPACLPWWVTRSYTRVGNPLIYPGGIYQEGYTYVHTQGGIYGYLSYPRVYKGF